MTSDEHPDPTPTTRSHRRPPTRRVRIQTDAAARGPVAAGDRTPQGHRFAAPEVVFDAQDVSVFYGAKQALTDVTLRIRRGEITALIGPSGCGKTTFLRSLNRMNDSVPSFRIEGQILYHGHDIYGGNVDQVEVRRRIGMVFQKPNPFPKSIYDNIAWAPRNLGLQPGISTSGSRKRCAARRSGTRSRTGSRTAPSASPAASSSGSASPARSRSSPTCCCSTSPPRRSTRSPPARSRT